MNGTSRKPLSSQCIIKCIVDAYAYEGDSLVVQMIPKVPKSGWDVGMPCNKAPGIPKSGYEFVVIGPLKYDLLLRGDVVAESPRSGGPSHDRSAIDASRQLQVANYEVLAWRPYCEEVIPYMDRDGNNLPITERPPLKNPEELEDTDQGSTVSELRKQILELKKTVKWNAISEIQLRLEHYGERAEYYNSESRRRNDLQQLRGTVRENVDELKFLREKVKELEVANNIGNKDQHLSQLLEGLLDKMALSAERRRSKYLELKAVVLQKELDERDALSDFDKAFDLRKEERARNGQSRRLVQIAGDFKDACDRLKSVGAAIYKAKEEMETAEQNLLQ
ncbi:hypothetical protein FPANT_7140 [Fusarium pseudoanthophilum]|uniref:Uncharacterized protein n=1 Tax=Fusarium pseudoanthophilum TaxID=48495 RepID=A0A8H5L8X0_9HYPO|nr:hypothetical protein FPANT_7140 [Fusarium pseudoanthophilum]